MRPASWLTLLALAVAAVVAAEQSVFQVVDLERLRGTGEDWEIVAVDLEPEAGFVRLHQDWWLMYFLHWRPLTRENSEVTPEYVRNLLVSFWGPGMPFTLTGREGPLTVGGHRAYFVEATIYDGAVHTRFIVWNCRESGRQLIADANVNRRVGTPIELLDLQREVTMTVCCHGQPQQYRLAALPQHFVSSVYGLSFDLPSSWRTREYRDPDWFPDGMTATKGSLWTLTTDSEKRIDVVWRRDGREPSPGVLAEYLELMRRPFSPRPGARVTIAGLQLTEIEENADRVVAGGRYELSVRSNGRQSTKPHRFRSFLWRDGARMYLASASMVALQEFWKIANDLSPSAEVFDRFLCRRLWPALRVPNPLAATCSSLAPYLAPTPRIDSGHPRIIAVARRLTRGYSSAGERARRLYEFVRDMRPVEGQECSSQAASDILECRVNGCFARSILLAALARSAGIPARLQLQRVTIRGYDAGNGNRTDETFAHGVAALYLEGRWHLYEPTGNRDKWVTWTQDASRGDEMPVQFDPTRDCLFPSDDRIAIETLPVHFTDWSDELVAEIVKIDGGKYL